MPKLANSSVFVSARSKQWIVSAAAEMTKEDGRKVGQAEVVERAIEALRRERQEA